jgi:hypothetical protein
VREFYGFFPLISNEVTMSAKDLLLAYKQQPMMEKRFAQLETDFVVAPVYLKEVSRIQALLCVYFLALLVESLLERELRRAIDSEGIASLTLYLEGRACGRPTARKVIDLVEDVQRHELSAGRRPPPVVFTTKLSRLQRKILRLLKREDAASIAGALGEGSRTPLLPVESLANSCSFQAVADSSAFQFPSRRPGCRLISRTPAAQSRHLGLRRAGLPA